MAQPVVGSIPLIIAYSYLVLDEDFDKIIGKSGGNR
jgi:hypothetical protein